MKRFARIGCILLGACLWSLPAPAQTAGDQGLALLRADSASRSRFVTRVTSYGVGYTNLQHTYLSPEEYTGTEVRLTHESLRPTRWANGRLWRQSFLQGHTSYTGNRADNNNTLSALANWNLGLLYDLSLGPSLNVWVGGLSNANLGLMYNLRNGNNPVAALAYWNLDASALVQKDVRLFGHPIRLRYQVSVPLAGVMFSPHYGQSYYEIFSLKHDEGTLHLTSLHNQPSLRQMLSADVPVGKAKLRLSCLIDTQQSSIDGIKAHQYSYVFLIGIVKEVFKL